MTRLAATSRAYWNVARAVAKNINDQPGLPRAAHLIPTWRCDLRCATCQVWRKPETERELSTDDWIRVVERLHVLDVVKIIGGEPFARDDLEPIVDAVWRFIDPWMVQITSAGTRTDTILSFLEKQGRPGLQLRISLDGFAESYQRMRGSAEGFHAANRTLQEAARLAQKRGFTLGVNFCVTDDSVDDLPDMIEYCRELGVDCVPGIAVKPFLEHVEDWSKVHHRVLMVKDAARISTALRDARLGPQEKLDRAVKWFLRRSNDAIFDDRLGGRQDGRRFRCREIRDLAYVLPTADVVVCGLRYDVVGNLLTHSVEDIWSSPRAVEMRRVVDQCPGCNQASTEIMSRLYSGYWG